MVPYIGKVISAFPEKIKGVQSTPAGDRLFQVRSDTEAKLLPKEQTRAFHHTIAQLLFLLLFLSCVQRNFQTTIAFLATRVNSLTAIDGHDRQYFYELRARVVSP